jgi:hypothetical protein
LEFLVGAEWGDSETVVFVTQLGVGLGGAVFDFKGGLEDEGGAAAEIRVRLGVTLFEHVEVAGSGGLFIFGYPTETMGQGGFFTLEAGVRF